MAQSTGCSHHELLLASFVTSLPGPPAGSFLLAPYSSKEEGVRHQGPGVPGCPHPGKEKPLTGCPPLQLIPAFLLSPGISSSAWEARLGEAGRLSCPACTDQKLPGINTCGAFSSHSSLSPHANLVFHPQKKAVWPEAKLSAPTHLGTTRWPLTSLNSGVFLRKSSAAGCSPHNPAQEQGRETQFC